MISLTMPSDVRAYVLDYQGKKKANTGLGHYSQQHAILSLIREHKEQAEEIGLLKTAIAELRKLLLLKEEMTKT